MNRLCSAASYAPVAITLHCEQILSEIARLDPAKFIGLISRFISENQILNESIEAPKELLSAVQLLTLHALATAIKHISSVELLIELPLMMPLILPAFKSELVDVRKAIVFVLVAIYVVVGDVLHSHVSSLTPPQKKLLTIYIEKNMSQRPKNET